MSVRSSRSMVSFMRRRSPGERSSATHGAGRNAHVTRACSWRRWSWPAGSGPGLVVGIGGIAVGDHDWRERPGDPEGRVVPADAGPAPGETAPKSGSRPPTRRRGSGSRARTLSGRRARGRSRRSTPRRPTGSGSASPGAGRRRRRRSRRACSGPASPRRAARAGNGVLGAFRLVALNDVLHCAMLGSRPFARNSSAQ